MTLEQKSDGTDEEIIVLFSGEFVFFSRPKKWAQTEFWLDCRDQIIISSVTWKWIYNVCLMCFSRFLFDILYSHCTVNLQITNIQIYPRIK